MIPYSEVTGWLTENDIISLEERQWYRRFINFVDEVFVEKQQTKQKAKQSKNKPSGK